jgi:hypothetical protein
MLGTVGVMVANPQPWLVSRLTPVAFPPGRLRLGTNPILTGSPPVVNTLPNKLQADLWAFPDNMSAARKCSISLGRPGRPAFPPSTRFPQNYPQSGSRLKNSRRTRPIAIQQP